MKYVYRKSNLTCSYEKFVPDFETLSELLRIGTFETASLAHEEEADFFVVCLAHWAAGVLPFHLFVLQRDC